MHIHCVCVSFILFVVVVVVVYCTSFDIDFARIWLSQRYSIQRKSLNDKLKWMKSHWLRCLGLWHLLTAFAFIHICRWFVYSPSQCSASFRSWRIIACTLCAHVEWNKSITKFSLSFVFFPVCSCAFNFVKRCEMTMMLDTQAHNIRNMITMYALSGLKWGFEYKAKLLKTEKNRFNKILK